MKIKLININSCLPSSSDLPRGIYYMVKQQKGEKEVSMINSMLYSIMRYTRIDALPFNTKIEIVLDCPFGSYHGFSTNKFTICKVGKNLVRLTPVNYLNTILDSRLVKINRLSEPVAEVMELIQAPQKNSKRNFNKIGVHYEYKKSNGYNLWK